MKQKLCRLENTTQSTFLNGNDLSILGSIQRFYYKWLMSVSWLAGRVNCLGKEVLAASCYMQSESLELVPRHKYHLNWN